MDKKKVTIFYSWQSDLPNSTNRTFIETALEKAIEQYHGNTEAVLEPRIDRDTAEVPGSPDIPATIFEKIDQCHIFVGDVSIINGHIPDCRKTPNPNVLLELGYAAKTLSWDSVICVMNTAFADIGALPFDLQRRRMCTYSVTQAQEDKATSRNALSKLLHAAIARILQRVEGEMSPQANEDVLTPGRASSQVQEWLADESKRIQLHKLVHGEANKLAKEFAGPAFPVSGTEPVPSDILERVRKYEEMSAVLIGVLATGCYYGTPEHERLWVDAIKRVGNPPADSSGYTFLIKMRKYPALLLWYSASLGAIASQNFAMLNTLLSGLELRGRHKSETEPIAVALHPSDVIEDSTFSWMRNDKQRWFTPLSDHIFSVLREPLRAYLDDDLEYDEAFDRFEFIRALVELDSGNPLGGWPTIGRFGWKISRFDGGIRRLVSAEISRFQQKWPPLQAGMFGGDLNRLVTAQKKLDEQLGKLSWY